MRLRNIAFVLAVPFAIYGAGCADLRHRRHRGHHVRAGSPFLNRADSIKFG